MSKRRRLREKEIMEIIADSKSESDSDRDVRNENNKRLKKKVTRRILDSDESEKETNIYAGAETTSEVTDGSDVVCDSDDSIIDSDYFPDKTIPEYISDEENISDVLQNLILQEEDELNKSDNEQDDVELVTNTDGWSEYMSRHKTFPFIERHGIQKMIPPNYTPVDIFRLIIDEEVINYIVTETNRFAEQTMSSKLTTPHARVSKWIPTNATEMEKFFGLVMWMGLVRLPTLPGYWSKQGVYRQEVPRTIMPRNRFQILLAMLHFNNNEETHHIDNRLRKIQPLVDMLETKFQELFYPGEDVVIDETLVPWKGRLIFRQYIPNKAHCYGIKLFKLCSVDGYTWALKIYSGRSPSGERQIGLAENVCLELLGSFLNEGRSLYVDNFYTSYNLAKSLLEQGTHVIGTLRTNTKDIPKEILHAKLQRGEIISCEDANGIVVLKWKDVRDVRLLSTKHPPHLVPTNKSLMEKQNFPLSRKTKSKIPSTKPIGVLAYNKAKAGIDLSDQMASYATTLRRGVKWYKKLGIELILGVAVVNAWVVYKHLTRERTQIRTFREHLVASLLNMDPDRQTHPKPSTNKHLLINRTDENGKKIRRKCSECYAKMVKEEGRQAARKRAKMVNTYCSQCPGHPQICLNCFNLKHKSI